MLSYSIASTFLEFGCENTFKNIFSESMYCLISSFTVNIHVSLGEAELDGNPFTSTVELVSILHQFVLSISVLTFTLLKSFTNFYKKSSFSELNNIFIKFNIFFTK